LKRAILISIIFLLVVCVISEAGEFKQSQLQFQRVGEAYSEKSAEMESILNEGNCEFPPQKILLRIFKEESELELWAESKNYDQFTLIKTYNIVSKSGDLGPKRKQGDRQVPEGFYFIDAFNPQSNFYLSLRINYPNESNKILGERSNLGGDIFIHGGFATIGCIPITDDFIKELYVIAVETKDNGQAKIPVHIFPFKMTDEAFQEKIKANLYNSQFKNFWNNLKEGYVYF
jgi:murein L,D-transpeptidase YafK